MRRRVPIQRFPRLPRRAVRQWHRRQSQRRRRAVRHLSDGLRAHLRRLLFPDLVFDGTRPLCRRSEGLSAALPSLRRRRSSPITRSGESIDQAVSAAGQPSATLPNAFRYRKQVTQGCRARAGPTRSRSGRQRDARERRHRRDRQRQRAVAGAAGRGPSGRQAASEPHTTPTRPTASATCASSGRRSCRAAFQPPINADRPACVPAPTHQKSDVRLES